MKLDPLADYSRVDVNSMMADLAANHGRVWQDSETKTFFVVRFDDVVGLLNSRHLTTRQTGENLRPLPAEAHQAREEMSRRFARWPLFSDGDYHAQVRVELAGVFKDAESRAAKRVSALLAAAIPGDGRTVDWLRVVAEPVAVEILALVLGVERGEARRIEEWAAPILESLATPIKDHELMVATIAGMESLTQWLRGRLGPLASAPPPDVPFLAALGRIARDPRLGPDAAAGALAQVVTGTLDPLISAAVMLGLIATPEAQAELSVRDLVEEALRLGTPFRFARRFVLAPLEVAGVCIPAGAKVLLFLGSANMDAERFACPHRAAAGRPSHVAFSRGLRYCPGAELVRAGLTALATALTEARLAFRPAEVVRPREMNMLRYLEVTGDVVHHG